jgi:hypothetical protein
MWTGNERHGTYRAFSWDTAHFCQALWTPVTTSANCIVALTQTCPIRRVVSCDSGWEAHLNQLSCFHFGCNCPWRNTLQNQFFVMSLIHDNSVEPICFLAHLFADFDFGRQPDNRNHNLTRFESFNGTVDVVGIVCCQTRIYDQDLTSAV